MTTINNRVNLIGNLGNEPEIKTFESNKKMARFSLATSDFFKDKNGERNQQTTWHNIICWNSMADIAEKLLHKGHKIALEGKLVNRSYEDKEGNTKYITEIVMNEMMLLSKQEK